MKYICSVCGYIYDEEAEGVPFADLPDDWKCPVCGEGKDGFDPVIEDAVPAKKVSNDSQVEAWEAEELHELSAGELSAVCSNLARGCQKQQLERQAELFTQLSDYFESRSVVPDNEGVTTLLDLINKDMERYDSAKALSAEMGDRGALRILTWSEKVTKICMTLLERYQKDPHFIDNTNVYVCDICGFIYIGDEPPAVCPVCKVPGFMILKIKRRV